jgi:hypothetical protein
MQVTLWSISLTSLAIVGLSGWADRRRARRQNLDDVGFVPWPLIMILGMISAAVATALALHTR